VLRIVEAKTLVFSRFSALVDDLNDAERAYIREITLIDTELEHRSVRSARALQKRVKHLREFFFCFCERRLRLLCAPVTTLG